MTTTDPLVAQLTAPDQMFAIGERDGVRQFLKAPPDLATLVDSARRHGDATMIVEAEGRYSYADMFARADALAAELSIQPGDRVAIAMRNRSEWMVAFLAVLRRGGVNVQLNSRAAGEELNQLVADTTPVLVIADEKCADRMTGAGYDGSLLLARDFPAPGAEPPPLHRAAPDDPCAILFTSGTTGRAKGAVLTNRNMVSSLMSVQLSGFLVLHNMANKLGLPAETLMANAPQFATLLVFPLFHISGVVSGFLSPMLSGGKVVIMRRWDPDEALRLIADEKITMFSAVPTMLWDIVNRSGTDGADLSSLNNVGTGGQAMPLALLEQIRTACPQAAMGTGYGMTETAGGVAMSVGEDFIRNRKAAGRPFELAEMRILDDDDNPLPTGEVGEIAVRGALVMKEYFGRPEETAEVFTADGWMKTGDVGYLDDENYVYIVDRKRDMVISGGENIYCAEVERVIGQMDGVEENAAFGIPDDRLGEALVAIVRGKVDEDAVKSDVSERLAAYKSPSRVIVTEDPLPRNAVGKVDKIALRKQFIGEDA